MWTDQSLEQLAVAARSFDRSAAVAISEDLIAHLGAGGVLSAADRKSVLRLLRGCRCFQQLKLVTDALMAKPSGDARADAIVTRQNGQALIELGAFTDARRILKPLIDDPTGSEWAEAKGLRGRSYKQEYVNSAGAGLPASDAILNAAIREYADVYRRFPTTSFWHGINFVALAKRGRRDRVTPETDLSPDQVAADVLKALEPTLGDDSGVWDHATAAEASLALGDIAGALEKLKAYVSPERKADAFEIASTLRQLEEVWQIREDSPQGALVSVLRAALLQREGGSVELGVGDLQRSIDTSAGSAGAFEKVFGRAGPQTLSWYRLGLARAAAVARIETLSGRGFGTGFLIRAGDFFPNLQEPLRDERLLMTNAHVLGQTSAGALRPVDAAVRFEALGTQQRTIAVKELVWESAQDDLDVTIVRLSSAVTGVDVIPIAPAVEPVFAADRPRRLYVIGHPRGSDLALSMEDNLQVGWKRPRVHYRTPTEPGSSGSPVFDDNWRLLALHHSGSAQMSRLDGQPGIYEANEGIWIHDILSRTRALAPVFETATPAPRPAFRHGIIISYSHRDRRWLDELTTALAPVLQADQLDLWDDRRIPPGADWEREIEKAMDAARIAVLLVSPHFLASEFITRREMTTLLRASRERGLTVFWVPVGAAYYEATDLGRIQAAWDPKRPLNVLNVPQRQAAWVEITKRLVEAADLSRVSSMLRLADQVEQKVGGLGGTGTTPPSVTFRQVDDKIELQRGSRVYETITADEMDQLDEHTRQLIRAHEAAIQRLFDEFTELYPNRAARDAAVRRRAETRIEELRRELGFELGEILGFVESMGKHLDDHYLHVRAILRTAPGA